MKTGKNPGDYSLKMLVVEDNFDSRRMLQKMLLPFGECDIAVNGKEAVEAFEKALDEEFSYDLVCLDILMPVMDGQETLKRIREIEEARELYGRDGAKVIMTSALDDNENILKAFRTGCEGYITKPIEIKILVEKLKELGLLD